MGLLVALLLAVDPFAVALHQELAAKESGNLFYSPASIRIALGMALSGARGETAAELRAAGAPEPQDAAQLLSSLEAVNGDAARLRVANRVWVQQDYAVLHSFLDVLKTGFRSELGVANFVAAPEESRQAINDWVAKATERMIPSLFPPDSIARDTRLVLANAVYFQGTWEHRFDERSTADAPFLTGEREVRAPLMQQEGHYRLARFGGATMIELPYEGNRMAMDVLLPDDRRAGIAGLEKSYAEHGEQPWVDRLERAKVLLWLPRFKSQWGAELTEPLRALGIRRAFTREADFSGIDGTRQLHVGVVEHKAAVEVDETGTRAAAATGMGVVAVSMPAPEKTVVFRADHPFLYFIRDRRTSALLFAGRLTNPRE